MIQECKQSGVSEDDINKILRFIGKKYIQVPYLYLNLKKYGVTNPNVKVWIDMDDSDIQAVYLKYYDCLHFYTQLSEYPVERYAEMLNAEKPKVLMIPDRCLMKMKNSAFDNYCGEEMYVFDITASEQKMECKEVEPASREELIEIAELLLNDAEYKNVYTIDTLLAQIYQRYEDGFSRFFVIRREHKIIATYSTMGEDEKMAVIGGLLVHPEFRGQGIGKRFIRHMSFLLALEGKRAIDLVYKHNTSSLALHDKKMGPISTMYKCVKNPR